MNKTVQENVAELLIKGHTDVEIAEILKISKHTVKSHIAILERKYMVKNYTNLAYCLSCKKV